MFGTLILAASLGVAAFVGAAEPPSPGQKGAVSKPKPPELPKPHKIVVDTSLPEKSQATIKKRLDEVEFQHIIDWEVERDDRNDLVWPAAKDYKPQVAARKLEMRLIPRSAHLSKGESLWYRIEIQNVGDRNSGISNAAFLKGDGAPRSTPFHFVVVGPDGKSEEILLGSKASHLKRGDSSPELHLTKDEIANMRFLEDFDCGPSGDAYAASFIKTPDWTHLSDADRRKAFREWQYRQGAKDSLRVTLLPGETLESRPWEFHPCEQEEARRARGLGPFPPPPGRFRELKTPYPFDKPGTYRIKVVYRGDLPDPPPSEAEIQKYLGRGATRKKIAESHDRMQTFSPGIIESAEIKVERLP